MSLTISYEEKRDLLIGMSYKRSNTGVASRTYSYDAAGRPITRSTSRNVQTVTDSFGYNNRSELTAATVNNGTYSYNYDNIGNRNTAQGITEEITNYTANNLNQYTAIGDFAPTYDAAGNQTLVKTTTGIWTVAYDAENRPVSFTNAESNTVIECAYDHMGRRATKKVTVDGEVTLHHRYLYRGFLQIACCDLTRSNHPALWLITWDPSQPIATRPLAIQKDGTWYTYGWDLTKNICELYGQHGYIRTNYTYTPYGAVTASGDVTQPIQWSSEFHDTELALVYYNYRHYNPTDGRWLGRDRAKKGYNLYLFTKNNALRYLDYLGNVFVLPSHSTSGMPGAQQEHIRIDNRIPKSGCNIFICCKRVFLLKSAHCVIRFTYASGTVRGCRGGPTGNGPSNFWYNREEGIKSNNQGTHCKGCCGSYGNVIAGCGEETSNKEQNNPLQEGVNSDISHAQFWHDTCTLIKHAENAECSQIYNCIKKEMKKITDACYIYEPLGNNSNSSWKTAYQNCISKTIFDPENEQPGNFPFNETKRCNK